MPVSTRSRTRGGPRSNPPHYVYDDDDDSSVERKPVVKTVKKTVKRKYEEDDDETSWTGDEVLTVANRGERMRLRPWLEQQVNGGKCPGLQWIDLKNKIVRIPWKHASRHGWKLGDASLFQRWAIHSGKYREGMKPNPKRWKANFRCALNSLPDIKEVKHYSQKRGSNAFKVYQFLPSGKKTGVSKVKTMKTSTDFQEDGEKTALRVCDVNMLPVTVTDLENKVDEEEKQETKKENKPKSRKRVSRVGRRIKKEHDAEDDDQQVPDEKYFYNRPQLLDHDSYTTFADIDEKVKVKAEIPNSCNNGYKFNGSPTEDFRMDAYRQSQTFGETESDDYDVDTGDDDSDILTDEQVINEVIEMETSCSSTSSSDSELHGFDAHSTSSIQEWMTDDFPSSNLNSHTTQYNKPLPHSDYYQHQIVSPYTINTFIGSYYHKQNITSGSWGEQLIEDDPFLDSFHDDIRTPCIVQRISENETKRFGWEPLQYQDL